MKNTGLTLLALAIFLWVFDRVAFFTSIGLGKVVCGEEYLRPVNGIVGGDSCGFNADIYLVVAPFAMLMLGSALYYGGKRELRDSEA